MKNVINEEFYRSTSTSQTGAQANHPYYIILMTVCLQMLRLTYKTNMTTISRRSEDCRNWHDPFNAFELDLEFVCASTTDSMLLTLALEIVCVNTTAVDIGPSIPKPNNFKIEVLETELIKLMRNAKFYEQHQNSL